MVKQHFGLPSLRPGQLEAIESILAGRDTLVVMPTGSGKSLIYQTAALLRPGLTLVVSPLIALMHDQVDSLAGRDLPTTYVNSSLSSGEQQRRLQAIAKGQYRLVYVAPERLRSLAFQEALAHVQVGLLAVDEAHCISQWGHDFRSDYQRLGEARRQLGGPVTIALTATATPPVQVDIEQSLGLADARRIVAGFNRPELIYRVYPAADDVAKLQVLASLCARWYQDPLVRSEARPRAGPVEPAAPGGAGSSIESLSGQGAVLVYVGTRHQAEQVASFLRQLLGLEAVAYHAGLAHDQRQRIQAAFRAGRPLVVVATNAFGLGIDRPDVRLVVHYTLPGSLELYYQEAGRAGRDGQPAQAILLYNPADRALHDHFLSGVAPSRLELLALHESLPAGAAGDWTTEAELARRSHLASDKIRLWLAQLEAAGVVTRLGDEGQRMRLRREAWSETAIQTALAHFARYRRHRQTQVEQVIHYAHRYHCRRRLLLAYFGDQGAAESEPCCDYCQAMNQPSGAPLGRVARRFMVRVGLYRPRPQPLPAAPVTQAQVAAFLQAHTRHLDGPWQSGWALAYHSQFQGDGRRRTELGEWVWRLKYQQDPRALPPLVEQVAAFWAGRPELAAVEALIPIPPSVARPHDPVRLVAEALGARVERPVWPILVKTRRTAPQKDIHSRYQKVANVAGAFALHGGEVSGRCVLVLDDLYDSGATLAEATRLLQRAGAGLVYVLALTRTAHTDV